ncbi:hypothetical protein D3C76_1240070 [compost metagenome]
MRSKTQSGTVAKLLPIKPEFHGFAQFDSMGLVPRFTPAPFYERPRPAHATAFYSQINPRGGCVASARFHAVILAWLHQ